MISLEPWMLLLQKKKIPNSICFVHQEKPKLRYIRLSMFQGPKRHKVKNSTKWHKNVANKVHDSVSYLKRIMCLTVL